MMLGFKKKKAILAPVNGRIIPIEQVADPVFAKKMMGDGFALIPDGEIISACGDGTITMLYPSLHAIGLTMEDGLELLIHIGIDTVNEDGNGFSAFVAQGDYVHAGDRLVQFDKEALDTKGYDLSVIVIFTNRESYKEFHVEQGYVTSGLDAAAHYWQ